jgi:hypothetical protein
VLRNNHQAVSQGNINSRRRGLQIDPRWAFTLFAAHT